MNDLKSISEGLKKAKKHNLESEFIFSLIQLSKNNKNYNTEKLVEKALDDWDIV